MLAIITNFLIEFLRVVIKFYKLCVSSLYGPRCRFLPTCSDYAEEAVKIHGLIRGIVLIVFRLIRCNFLAKQRVDPVPRKNNREV